MDFSIKNIETARERIKDRVYKTPLIKSHKLSDLFDFDLYLKLENMQKTGSFKYRGAMNKILSLDEDRLAKGIVCASSGNHGRALAYACKDLGISCIVVMPDSAPEGKIQAIKDLQAEIVLCEAKDRFILAKQIRDRRNMTLVPPFDDLEVMAGQGTCGLEIIEDLPDLDYVLVPVSGGGLIGGVATAIKARSQDTKIIGAEPAMASAYKHSLGLGYPDQVEAKPTIADALVSNRPGDLNFPVVQSQVDGLMAVSERYIDLGHKVLLMEGKILAEASASIGLGGIMEGLYEIPSGSKVCFIISGGSVSLNQLDRLKGIDYGDF